MARDERQQPVLDILQELRGLEPLKQLFWSELSYQRVNQPLSRRGWTDAAHDALAEDPILFAAHNDFHILLLRLASEKLLLGPERPVVSRLLQDHPYSLFVFSNSSRDRWHFLNVKYDGQRERRRLFRRITVGPEERLRTASERLAMLDVAENTEWIQALRRPLGVNDIQQRHDEAFDVEAVTRQFFRDYNEAFENLEADLQRQTGDRTWAHEYALLFLNRLMFLYFVQRKGWLGDEREFLRFFWKSYKESGQPQDSFYDCWLRVLFFEAFDKKPPRGYRHFPDGIKKALVLAPYLNGGLFRENELDRRSGYNVTDSSFDRCFRFMEHYNFTIAEDSPLDQEVAVDPEMIGKVYESLVNVPAEADTRGDAGIFYTPRTEIDLMCRLALVDHLANHLGQKNKDVLSEAVFALEPEEKEAADGALARANLWPALSQLLQEIAVLDPACGSGSFLVGMLGILDDLGRRAATALLKDVEKSYERKKRIIGQNLYGVDVMEWACRVAELRLWLALIIDADFAREELCLRREPLLPNFTFKIRPGDSLVQELGGINLRNIGSSQEISRPLKARIARLKNEKQKFYHNDPSCLFNSQLEVILEEQRLFREILDYRNKSILDEMYSLRRKIEDPEKRQLRLDGTIEGRTRQMELEAAGWKKRVEELADELERVIRASEALRPDKPAPFAWDLAFVEIFGGEKRGFDIVIGNPPYVRQENISEPHMPRKEVTAVNKKAYKEKLIRSVYQAYPRFFGYNARKDTAEHKIDAKSDLYIYFYFHGLSLLNPKGSFCFITSNSWLDVGYGKNLQEFLLKHCHLKMVLDNQARRSFAAADVNTVIVLISPPDHTRACGLDQTARFVMFKVPFEQTLSPVIFEEIEAAADRRTKPEYRVFPIGQRTLLEDGCEIPKDEGGASAKGPLIKVSCYIGNKWGGKYLRAPDIYWTILEKGKDKLVRLGDIAEVRFGIKTGANEFFYLNEARIREWGIEEEFLRPVIVSPRECDSVEVELRNLCFKAFICHKDFHQLRGTAALDYIRWGEKQGYHLRPSLRHKSKWYDFPEKDWAKVLWPMIHNNRLTVPWNPNRVAVDHNLFEIFGFDDDLLWGSLAWSAQILFRELHGRSNLGQGALKTEGIDIKTLNILRFKTEDIVAGIKFARVSLSKRKIGTVEYESMTLDRRSLDNIFFDALGLTQGERDAVYEAVINLVEARLGKARSLRPRDI